MDVEAELASQIHDEMCNDTPNCGRWVPDSPHRQYYHGKAVSIISQLEPEIGIANVFIAVRAILSELS